MIPKTWLIGVLETKFQANCAHSLNTIQIWSGDTIIISAQKYKKYNILNIWKHLIKGQNQ